MYSFDLVVPFLGVNWGEIIRDVLYVYVFYITLKTLETNNKRATFSHIFE